MPHRPYVFALPTLFINAEPGSILGGAQRDICRSRPNQTEVTVAGFHFIQEDNPHEIGRAIRDWLPTLHGFTIKVGRFLDTVNGKANALGESDGPIKTILEECAGELLRAHMI